MGDGRRDLVVEIRDPDDIVRIADAMGEWRAAKRHDDPECACRWCGAHRLLDELRAENAVRYRAFLHMRLADGTPDEERDGG